MNAQYIMVEINWVVRFYYYYLKIITTGTYSFLSSEQDFLSFYQLSLLLRSLLMNTMTVIFNLLHLSIIMHLNVAKNFILVIPCKDTLKLLWYGAYTREALCIQLLLYKSAACASLLCFM